MWEFSLYFNHLRLSRGVVTWRSNDKVQEKFCDAARRGCGIMMLLRDRRGRPARTDWTRPSQPDQPDPVMEGQVARPDDTPNDKLPRPRLMELANRLREHAEKIN